MEKMRQWIKRNPGLWEFIKFNVLSNCATITNFLVLWSSTSFLFSSWSQVDFQWGPFDYTVSKGGLGGFYAFLLAYVVAQYVNYFVQRIFVFEAKNNITSTMHWYILTVVVAGIISIILPPYVIGALSQSGINLGVAQLVANIINIIVQVVINYPMMKFVIMKQ